MSAASSLALYTHVLGVVEGGGFLYLLYRKRAEFARNSALALPVLGLVLFVAVEVAMGHLSPLVVHLGHAVAAAGIAVGLAVLVVRWATTRPATAPVPRDGTRPGWMTEMDDEILSLLDAADAVLTPALVSYNLDYSRESVNRHLRTLESQGYVERVDRGKYRLADADHPHWHVATSASVQSYAERVRRRVVKPIAQRLERVRRTQRSGR